MAYEHLTDLIKQIQISTRANAGLSDYDPDRSSHFPAVPSLSENVASLDPSPPYLRCKHCKGRLLRGVQSLLCIYCGRLNDVAYPDPISFKDTIGYSWLLQSLHLDGSELVEQPSEKNVTKKGQSTTQHKIPLTDFLNLKILWPAEPEKEDQSDNFIRWTGVELDDFFLESKQVKVARAIEQPTIINQVKNSDIRHVATPDNLNLFQHVQPSQAATSSEDKSYESSGWQADFQSVDAGNQQGASLSFGTSTDSTVDLSVHIDWVFGSGKDLKDENPTASSATVNWKSDDLWNNSISEGFLQEDTFDSSERVQKSQTKNSVNNPSASSDWFPGDEWHTPNNVQPHNVITNEDDSFDEWNDFTGSSSIEDPSRNAWTQGDMKSVTFHEKPSEDLIVSGSKLDEMDLNSFQGTDLLSGFPSQTDANGSAAGTSASDRTLADAGGHGSIASPNGSTKPKEDVQMLISQMHDLSFMLENDLSIPSKSDTLDCFL